MICLFIGGPADGLRIETGERDLFETMDTRLTEGGIRSVTYKKVRLCNAQNEDFFVFVPRRGETDVIAALIHGYAGGGKKIAGHFIASSGIVEIDRKERIEMMRSGDYKKRVTVTLSNDVILSNE